MFAKYHRKRNTTRNKLRAGIAISVALLLWIVIFVDFDFRQSASKPLSITNSLMWRPFRGFSTKFQNQGLVRKAGDRFGGFDFTPSIEATAKLAQCSPIDVVTIKNQNTTNVHFLGPIWPTFSLNYERPFSNVQIKNTGDAIVSILKDMSENYIKNGPLDSPFVLKEFVLHWGSEHTVNGYRFAAELQLVHYNKRNYQTYAKASKRYEGLAVVAVFFKFGQHNREMQTIINSLEYISEPGDTAYLAQQLDFSSLIPKYGNDHYWTYVGSFSDQGCIARWILIANPMDISRHQIAQLQQIYSMAPKGLKANNGTLMLKNYRMTVPVNNRIVRSSWR